MARWGHGRKVVREALDDADKAGFAIDVNTGHGHTWGYVRCPACGGKLPVFSTPRNDDNHAKRLRAFVRRHRARHQEQ